MTHESDPTDQPVAQNAPRRVNSLLQDLDDIESLDDADCDRFDDLTVHFGNHSWTGDDEGF